MPPGGNTPCLHAPEFSSLVVTSLVAIASTTASAASQLSSAPHFLVLADRERIVLFSDGPVSGAMADTRPDGTIEVTVPRLAVADSIAGRAFDDAGSGGTGKTRLRVVAGPTATSAC